MLHDLEIPFQRNGDAIDTKPCFFANMQKSFQITLLRTACADVHTDFVFPADNRIVCNLITEILTYLPCRHFR